MLGKRPYHMNACAQTTFRNRFVLIANVLYIRSTSTYEEVAKWREIILVPIHFIEVLFFFYVNGNLLETYVVYVSVCGGWCWTSFFNASGFFLSSSFYIKVKAKHRVFILRARKKSAVSTRIAFRFILLIFFGTFFFFVPCWIANSRLLSLHTHATMVPVFHIHLSACFHSFLVLPD